MLLGWPARFVEPRGFGWVFPAGAGCHCFLQVPGMVRRPDVSFIKAGRFPGDVAPKGWIIITPELAVRAVPRRDRAWVVNEKLADYRITGIPLTWVIHPASRSVIVHRADGSMAWLLEADGLSGEKSPDRFSMPDRGDASRSDAKPLASHSAPEARRDSRGLLPNFLPTHHFGMPGSSRSTAIRPASQGRPLPGPTRALPAGNHWRFHQPLDAATPSK